MKWSAGLAFLRARQARDAACDPADDGGDMGTAFGLDASFGPVDEAAATDAAPPEPQPWEARLIRRSGL